jgi:hypothetical protein
VQYNGQLNVMDPTTIDPVGSNIANFYPQPTDLNSLTENYLANQNNVNDQDSFDIRLDHRFREQDQMFATASVIYAASNPALSGRCGEVPIAARALATLALNTSASVTRILFLSGS